MQHQLLADIVRQMSKDSGMGYAQIARLSGIPAKTISSWANGYVKRPRYWRDLLRYARAIQLSKADAQRLLRCAEHSDLDTLRRGADGSDLELLDFWNEENSSHQIPRLDVSELYGRRIESAQLQQQLLPGTVCIVQGMGGIGKTTLTAKTAQALAHKFRDGVLWADLRNSSVSAILENWGQTFGIDLTTLPDEKSRAARMWGVLAKKQLLIILDDVISSAQARLLLPTRHTQCATIVTTRSQETAVALTTNPNNIIQLQPFTNDDGTKLLGHIIGDDVIAQNPSIARNICDLLGQLPLALTIVGRRYLAFRQPLSQIQHRLQDIRTRLDQLHLGPDLGVRLAFEQSWELLNVAEQQAFVLLAVFAGRSFTESAFTAIGQLTIDNAIEMQSRLYALALLNIVAEHPRRYQQHPLLTSFAYEKSGDTEGVEIRYLHYYYDYTCTHQQAYQQLLREWSHIKSSLILAKKHAQYQMLLDFVQMLQPVLFTQGLYTDAREAFALAQEAAIHLGHESALADIRLNWAKATVEQEAYAEARQLLEQALQWYVQGDDRAKISDIYLRRARIELEEGDYEQVHQLLLDGQQMKIELGDKKGQALALFRLARLYRLVQELDRAEKYCSQALDIIDDDDLRIKIKCLRLLAKINVDRQQYGDAQAYISKALKYSRQLQDIDEIASTMYLNLIICVRLREQQCAEEFSIECLQLFQQLGSIKLQGLTLYEMSKLQAYIQLDYEHALETGYRSLDMLTEVNSAFNIVLILHHIGKLHFKMGNQEPARNVWQEALKIAIPQRHFLVANLNHLLEHGF